MSQEFRSELASIMADDLPEDEQLRQELATLLEQLRDRYERHAKEQVTTSSRNRWLHKARAVQMCITVVRTGELPNE